MILKLLVSYWIKSSWKVLLFFWNFILKVCFAKREFFFFFFPEFKENRLCKSPERERALYHVFSRDSAILLNTFTWMLSLVVALIKGPGNKTKPPPIPAIPFHGVLGKDVTLSFITGSSIDTGLIVVSIAMRHSRKISTPLAAFRRERTVAHTISHEQS